MQNIGVDHNMKLESNKELFKNTCFKKYGCKYSTQSEIMKTKSVETSLKQYGVKHPMQNE